MCAVSCRKQFLAVARSRRRVLRYLHENGLDITQYCDKKGFGTPLFHAIYYECTDIIRKFLRPRLHKQMQGRTDGRGLASLIPIHTSWQGICTFSVSTWRRHVTDSVIGQSRR